MASIQPTTPTRLHNSSSRRLTSNGQTFTPPHGDRKASSPRRAALGEITNNEQASSTIHTSSDDMKASIGVADENLPAPTPGQPRKTNKIFGTARRVMTENQPFDIKPDTEIVSMQRSTHHIDPEDSSSEAHALRMLSRKASQSPSAISRSSGKRRAISCTTTTTTTTQWDGLTSAENSDVENRNAALDPLASPTRPKTPSGRKSGSGLGGLSVGKRSSPTRRSTEGKTSVRKTSGRIGSVGAQAVRGHKVS